MRAFPAAIACVVLVAGGCRVLGVFPLPCERPSECPDGHTCNVRGACELADATGEGEGENVGEGEGEEGEGEEGEGEEGEGEGEGEALDCGGIDVFADAFDTFDETRWQVTFGAAQVTDGALETVSAPFSSIEVRGRVPVGLASGGVFEVELDMTSIGEGDRAYVGFYSVVDNSSYYAFRMTTTSMDIDFIEPGNSISVPISGRTALTQSRVRILSDGVTLSFVVEDPVGGPLELAAFLFSERLASVEPFFQHNTADPGGIMRVLSVGDRDLDGVVTPKPFCPIESLVDLFSDDALAPAFVPFGQDANCIVDEFEGEARMRVAAGPATCGIITTDVYVPGTVTIEVERAGRDDLVPTELQAGTGVYVTVISRDRSDYVELGVEAGGGFYCVIFDDGALPFAVGNNGFVGYEIVNLRMRVDGGDVVCEAADAFGAVIEAARVASPFEDGLVRVQAYAFATGDVAQLPFTVLIDAVNRP